MIEQKAIIKQINKYLESLSFNDDRTGSILLPSVVLKTWSRGYKFFFMLSSAEHEFLNDHKDKNVKKFGFFSGSDKPRMLFSRS